ncbi:quinate permease like protein [Verticillium longisporum]|uniref:Quinate permease n=4 Tax=Verticillium TaxID=1036719 RepID=G2XIK9_VERDV|nr:quinate permease [Verticillium dahliae VdLs.17]KAF3348072.1 AP-3 complex subunit sigma [Verticillium dahliae VDG2]KAF3358353.1 General alpha-glucoside permease [Verticillium dahliae VDG1]KAG7139287.1 quinate permease like protein [Verticillium longisporum]KAH6708001.1 quinate permease [Verticillium dahliae]EGY20362.1 quinate permease [Verticillium dahliae VdLs.17]
MAGGVKKPVNIFNLKNLGEPEGVFNWRLWFAVVSFGLLGAARGVDEGLISGAFKSKDFQRFIHYENYDHVEQTNIKANVSAMVQIGSVGGALIAFLICDKIGRIWATRQLCVVWAVGIIIFMCNNGHLGAVYAGRFIAGLGVGQTPVVGPVYLAEIAPASIRGLCTCMFTGFVYLGIVLAYFANYGCQLHLGDNTHNRWLVPTSLHIMFAGIIFILTFFQYESPRFLVKQGRVEEATSVMSHLRHLPEDHEYIVREISAIQMSHEAELEATRGASFFGKIKEMFLVPSNLYRVYLTSMVQILSQWSGAGSITLYAPDLFEILGVTGQNESLLVTAVFGIVKFCAAIICALFLVDVIGRKRALLIGITLQAIAMVYVAGFLTGIPQLGVVDDFEVPKKDLGASRGAIAMIYISGFGWALGWNSMQYLLTAELFPLRIRALATSWAMTLHFSNQYGNSRAVPNMLLPTGHGGISPKGTFWCFAAVTIIGGIWVWFFVPETGGRSLESMDRLFDLPWYRIGLFGNKDAEEQDAIYDEKAEAAEQNIGQSEHAEKRDERKEIA